MAEKLGICTNFGNCPRADEKEIIQVPAGEDFVCPEPDCGRPLSPAPKKGSPKLPLPLIVGILAVCAVAIAAWLLTTRTKPEEEFHARLKPILEYAARAGVDLSAGQLKDLLDFAESRKIGDKADQLIRNGKEAYQREQLTALEKGGEAVFSNEQSWCEQNEKWDVHTWEGKCGPGVDIRVLLSNGDFAKAGDLCRNVANDPRLKAVCSELKIPLTVRAVFQYRKQGASQSSDFLSLDATKESNGLTLTSKDNYKLSISASQNNVFFYIYQIDDNHDIRRIFPDPAWSPGDDNDNPISKDRRYEIPNGKEMFFYLDEGSGKEVLYFVASPYKADDLERLYGDIHKTTNQQERSNLVAEFLKKLQQRYVPSVPSVFYAKFEFIHDR